MTSRQDLPRDEVAFQAAVRRKIREYLAPMLGSVRRRSPTESDRAIRVRRRYRTGGRIDWPRYLMDTAIANAFTLMWAVDRDPRMRSWAADAPLFVQIARQEWEQMSGPSHLPRAAARTSR